MRAGGIFLMMIVASTPVSGRTLEPCPATPNCVSTRATDAHAIAPFRYQAPMPQALEQLVATLKSMPRTKVVAADDASVTVEFRTAVFRFVDDAVFVFDDVAKKVDFRSASRIGWSDFGVNRKRMESIRRAFEKK